MLKLASDLTGDLEGVTREQYLSDRRVWLMIDREVEMLGICANRVSEAFQKAHPEVPWRGIIGLRNVLAHQYEQVDHERVWSTLSRHLPELIAHLEPLVPPAPPDPEPEP